MCLAIVVSERVRGWEEQHIEQVFSHSAPTPTFPLFLKDGTGERENGRWTREVGMGGGGAVE